MPKIKKSGTESKLLISGVEMGTTEVLLHKIQLLSDLGKEKSFIKPSFDYMLK